MPLKDLTGQRPTDFSKWHRERLPKWCALADGDFWEVRYGKVVAFVETIRVGIGQFPQAGEWFHKDPWLKNWYPEADPRYPLWETKKVVLNFVFDLLNKRKPPLPVYIIYHTPLWYQGKTPHISHVKVFEWGKKRLYIFTEGQFMEWEESLWLGRLG